MNNLKDKIGYVILGSMITLGGVAIPNEHTIEDATQIWRPIGDYETKFYQVLNNDEIVVVGFETTDPELVGRDPQELFEEKLLESKQLSDEEVIEE
jgi:hypothetical protein